MEHLGENGRERMAQKAIGSGLITTDIRGVVTYINPTAEVITGFMKYQSLGQPLENIFRITDEKIRLNLKKYIRTMGCETISANFAICTADNCEKQIFSTLTSITNDFNEFIGVILVFEDITKAAEMTAACEKVDLCAQKSILAEELKHAIENEELLLHYQPKVDSRTGNLVGMEALVRWQHPKKGLIYPCDFIPLAEETGLIKALDEWVLRNVSLQLKHWRDLGYTNIRLSVNLSPWHIRQRNLPQMVAAVLKETGIDAESLELEISGSVAVHNIKSAVNILGELIEMGVRVSIDDFGTCYSSLNSLKHFPISYLKIDRTFISDIADNKNANAILKSIINIAHNLNLKVVAYGVETKEQLDFLQQLGCDEIQGFYISKPLPPEDVQKQMESKR